MTKKVFLHGVPDTPALWAPLLKELNLPADDVHTPALPGFSTALPAGFDCHMNSYANWVIDDIQKIHDQTGPVHLVGHDWGAVFTMRVASLRPDLIASWCVANAAIDPGYNWHSLAQRWQTPILGELVMMGMRGPFLHKGLVDGGMPESLADVEVPLIDKVMKKAILKLYRSAKNVSAEWSPEVDQMPDRGLLFWGQDDPYVSKDIAEKVAARTGAKLVLQPDTGHWSVAQRPKELATALQSHWSG